MESDGLDGFDYTQPLQYALSQLTGGYPTEDEQFANVHFPKPSSLSAMAEEDDADRPPPTTNEIIDELVENVDNYPKVVQTMMQRGLLKKRQQCRKCNRMMHLRRRKTCYEWRCRTRDKKGDCSSCSIKYGSWFELTKLSFKIIFNFLVMHCKNCSTGHMATMLKLSSHSVNEMRRIVYDLTDRITAKYGQIGKNKQGVYMELITLQPRKGSVNVYKVLAGQETGSNRCFAVVLSDSTTATFERMKNQYVDPQAHITMVKTLNENDANIATVSAVFFDEEEYYHHEKDRFFTNLRQNHPENVFSNFLTLQCWLNDQVVRKTEGKMMLEKCFEELRTYIE
ncbi:hypothetical protein GCK72_005978 [Caenorhabditis remanei]|uniref:Uncharacterized protein n=1 Tax=Caenorhabditis remanei TaxID=31234 RepID=A0A6A5HI20_CAERE|nr:hypothetical protein GCK72_005978 [Caenorhabditis remanei]KAF1766023.1 hypothetical protein GCK72_005978 [Caenorhabditis remanei]